MKKKKNIIILICICLLIIGIICVCLFFSFGKNEKVESPKKDDTEEVEIKEGYDEFGNELIVIYDTKEEVYNIITEKYLSPGETISPAREENGCWYYMSSNGIDEYFYCIQEPIIRIRSTYEIEIQEN